MESVKDKIVLCAFELFVKKGYSTTAVEEISKCAKVSKGLVYYYFKSKQEILKSIIELIELPVSKINTDDLMQMNLNKLFNKLLKLHLEYFITIKSICQQPFERIQRFYFEAINELTDYKESIREKYKELIEVLKQRLQEELNLNEQQAHLRSIFLFSSFEGIIYYLTFFPDEDWKELLTYAQNYPIFEF